jgi:hypothetical protein
MVPRRSRRNPKKAAPATTTTAAAAPEPAGPEFADPQRRQILMELQAVLLLYPKSRWSTAWACLWLADLACLKEFLQRAKRDPQFAACFLTCIEMDTRLVQTCKSFDLIIVPTN